MNSKNAYLTDFYIIHKPTFDKAENNMHRGHKVSVFRLGILGPCSMNVWITLVDKIA